MSQQTVTEADFVRLRGELLSSGGANASELADALTYAATLVRRLTETEQVIECQEKRITDLCEAHESVFIERDELQRRLEAIRQCVADDVRPEQAADYILWRGGFSEREIQIATKVAVESTNKERQKVRALLTPPEAK